jgi:hypothetical protein
MSSCSATIRSMALRLMAACAIGCATEALAMEPPRDGPVRPTITRVQPSVTHQKANSFAPRRRSGRKVYGSPVSAPILTRTTPKASKPK